MAVALFHDPRRLGAAAGLAGSLLFVAVFVVEGALRPGYDPNAQYVSELSLGDRGGVQVANFTLSGGLLLLFAWGARKEFSGGKAAKVGPLLLLVVSACLLLSGPFVMDPASTPRDQWTARGTAHQVLGAAVMGLLPLAMLVFWRRFREDDRWRAMAWPTLAAFLVCAAALSFLKAGPTVPPEPPNPYNAWVGLAQRVALAAMFGWTAAVAMRMWRLPAPASPM